MNKRKVAAVACVLICFLSVAFWGCINKNPEPEPEPTSIPVPITDMFFNLEVYTEIEKEGYFSKNYLSFVVYAKLTLYNFSFQINFYNNNKEKIHMETLSFNYRIMPQSGRYTALRIALNVEPFSNYEVSNYIISSWDIYVLGGYVLLPKYT